MGFEDGIWASRQGFEPCGWDLGLDAKITVSKRDEGRDSGVGSRKEGWDLGMEDGV